MLKHRFDANRFLLELSAAFGRLCVETFVVTLKSLKKLSAAFGRLCVETASTTL